ncbi:MAG: hypothetical protein IJC55_04580 [Clostridia bacterium]|nr:hypothetical protein [Clostridia bacterium]
MPLSIFVDALSYTYLREQYKTLAPDADLAPLRPNIGYSSVLHCQLYCNRYPDARGTFVDWTKKPEPNRSVRVLSRLLQPLDHIAPLGWLSRKALDRIFFRSNTFANIPYRFRPLFSNCGKYLFFDRKNLENEEIFAGYCVVLQDEGRRSLADCMDEFLNLIQHDTKNIFLSFGFADQIGHTCQRGAQYNARLQESVRMLFDGIAQYHERFAQEEILLVSDHGMSTVQQSVRIDLQRHFGKESPKTYFCYRDTAVMCVFATQNALKETIAAYLQSLPYGHLLTESQRQYYGVTDRDFGDLIFVLHEGFVFEDNWFGKAARRSLHCGSSHGFWHGEGICDQTASVLLISQKRALQPFYEYPQAYELIRSVMQG